MKNVVNILIAKMCRKHQIKCMWKYIEKSSMFYVILLNQSNILEYDWLIQSIDSKLTNSNEILPDWYQNLFL